MIDDWIEYDCQYINGDTSIKAYYNGDDIYVYFRAIVSYKGKNVIWEKWRRKKLNYFDPDRMLSTPDKRILKIKKNLIKLNDRLGNIIAMKQSNQ